MSINISPTISDILLQNGTASLKGFYPLTEVKTKTDKKSLVAKGYAPGYTVFEWPYHLPADKIYYNRQLFPCTYYYNPDNAAIPIALNLNIYGTQRLLTIKDDNEFCTYILDYAESLKYPGKKNIFSYLLAQDDVLLSELLAEYIQRSDPSPDLYDLFLSFYTIIDYGAGVYLKGHSRKDNDIFFLAVQNGCHDIFLPDLCPDDPGMVFVSVSAGEEECSVDVCAPAECLVVRCAAFHFSPVDRNNLRKI